MPSQPSYSTAQGHQPPRDIPYRRAAISDLLIHTEDPVVPPALQRPCSPLAPLGEHRRRPEGPFQGSPRKIREPGPEYEDEEKDFVFHVKFVHNMTWDSVVTEFNARFRPRRDKDGLQSLYYRLTKQRRNGRGHSTDEMNDRQHEAAKWSCGQAVG